MSKTINRKIIEENKEVKVVNKYVKRCSTSLVNREIEIKTATYFSSDWDKQKSTFGLGEVSKIKNVIHC